MPDYRWLAIVFLLLPLLSQCSANSSVSASDETAASEAISQSKVDFSMQIRRGGTVVSEPRIVSQSGHPVQLETAIEGVPVSVRFDWAMSDRIVLIQGELANGADKKEIVTEVPLGETRVLATLADGTEIAVRPSLP